MNLFHLFAWFIVVWFIVVILYFPPKEHYAKFIEKQQKLDRGSKWNGQ